MKHLESSYTNIYIWATYIGKGMGGGGEVGTRSCICQNSFRKL